MSIERNHYMNPSEGLPIDINKTEKRPIPGGENLPPLDAPLYNNAKFQAFVNTELKFINQNRNRRRAAGDPNVPPNLPGNFALYRDSIRPIEHDNSNPAKLRKEEFENVIYSAEEFFRKLYKADKPEEIDIVKKDFQERLFNVIGENATQADLNQVTADINNYFQKDIAEMADMEQALLAQQSQVVDDFRNDRNYKFARYQMRFVSAVHQLQRQFEQIRGRGNPAAEQQVQDLLNNWTEMTSMIEFSTLYPEKAQAYLRNWIAQVTNPSNPSELRLAQQFWAGYTDPTARNQDIQYLNQNPFDFNAVNRVWDTVPDKTAFHHLKDLYDAHSIASRRVGPPNRPPEVNRPMPLDPNSVGRGAAENGRTDYKEDYRQIETADEPTLETILRSRYGLRPDEINQIKASPKLDSFGNNMPDVEKLRLAAKSHLSTIWEGELRKVNEKAPVRQRGETEDAFQRRRDQALQRLETGPRERTYSYLDKVEGRTLKSLTDEVNHQINLVADLNMDWDESNSGAIQQIMQAIRYVNTKEEQVINDRFDRGEIPSDQRERELEDIVRRKDEFVLLTQIKINLHNIRRMIITSSLEQVTKADLGLNAFSAKQLDGIPGFVRALNDISAFQGAYWRKEERLFGEDGIRVDTGGREMDAVEKKYIDAADIWMVRKRIRLMTEELSLIEDPYSPAGIPSRKEAIGFFKSEDRFRSFMTRVLGYDQKNKNASEGIPRERKPPIVHITQAFDEFMNENADLAMALRDEQKRIDDENKVLGIKGSAQKTDLRAELLSTLSSMTIESFQAYDLAYKSQQATMDGARFDGARWKKGDENDPASQIYQQKLNEYNERRRAHGLDAVTVMPNFAYMTEVYIPDKVNDPRTMQPHVDSVYKDENGQDVKIGRINLVDLENAQVWWERVEERAQQRRMLNRQITADYEKKRDEWESARQARIKQNQDDPGDYPEARPDLLAVPNLDNFDDPNLADDFQEIRDYANRCVVGQETLGYWNGKTGFEFHKFRAHVKMTQGIKGAGKQYAQVEAYANAKREFVRQNKFKFNILDPQNSDPLFARSLSGRSETLVRRLLNLSTYLRREQNANAIDILEMIELAELGADTMMHTTSRLSTREQLYNMNSDMSVLISVWNKRANGVEKARSILTDNPPIPLLSTGSNRGDMIKVLEKFQELQDYMTWEEKGAFFKFGMEEELDFNMREIKDRNKDFHFMGVVEAHANLIRAYMGNNISAQDFRDLESRMMLHWTLFEAAVVLHRLHMADATWATFVNLMKMVFK